MKEKFRVVCNTCGEILGVFDTSKIDAPNICSKCGGRKIATVKFIPQEYQDMEISVSIQNKRTGVAKNTGFILSKETLEANSKNVAKMRNVLATELAASLHNILKSGVIVAELTKGKEE